MILLIRCSVPLALTLALYVGVTIERSAERAGIQTSALAPTAVLEILSKASPKSTPSSTGAARSEGSLAAASAVDFLFLGTRNADRIAAPPGALSR
jgi:hypothetical protein